MATMNVEQMREKLMGMYNSSPRWVMKVKMMPDKQVIAVYYRIIETAGRH